MKKAILGILLYTISTSLFADASETGKVTEIIVEGSSIVSVFLDGADVNSECSGGSRWTIASSDALFKEKVSTLLAAAASQKDVTLHHLSSWGCGNWNSNKIYFVRVKY